MPNRLLAPATMATFLYLTTTAAPAQSPAPAQPSGTMNADKGWSAIGRCAQEETERARHSCVDAVLREAGLLTDEMHAKQQRRAFGLDDKPTREPAPVRATPPATAAATTAASPVTAAPTTTGSSSASGSHAPPTAGTSSTSAAQAPTTAGTSSATGTHAPTTGPSATVASPSGTGARGPAVAQSPATAAPSGSASPPPPQPDRLEVDLAKVEKAVNGRIFVTTTDGAVWLQTESVEMPQPPLAGDRMSIRKGSMGGYRCSVASTHLTYRCSRSR